jgi:predicted aldo/keto reductase-like oxidoreductase
MVEAFVRRGLTEEQACLKAVWEEPSIASICSQMPSMTLLKANVEAAAAEIELSGGDLRRLRRHAAATADQYCTGCSDRCESACGVSLPIADLMRCHMYHRSYGNLEQARELYRTIPPSVVRQMARTDFGPAERRCPAAMPIGRLVREAIESYGV